MKPSSQEATILASMGGALGGLLGYCAVMAAIYHSGQLTDARIGMSTLGLMIVCVLLSFSLRWLLHKAFAITEPWFPCTVLDERDKLIELKGMQASYATFAIGFVITMALLWSGAESTLGFALIAISLVVGELVSGCVRLYQYRSGY